MLTYSELDPNVCGYCGARFNEGVFNCPCCGKEFYVSEKSYEKQCFRNSLLLGITGILGTPFVIGVILSILGLTYALKAKSKALFILNLIPSVAILGFSIWWLLVR